MMGRCDHQLVVVLVKFSLGSRTDHQGRAPPFASCGQAVAYDLGSCVWRLLQQYLPEPN